MRDPAGGDTKLQPESIPVREYRARSQASRIGGPVAVAGPTSAAVYAQIASRTVYAR